MEKAFAIAFVLLAGVSNASAATVTVAFTGSSRIGGPPCFSTLLSGVK